MRSPFSVPSVKQIIISVCSGTAIFLITWFYINSYYTLSIEDSLYNNEAIIKHHLLKVHPEKNKQFLFISTGKDMSMVDDTGGTGTVTVSDRYKLFKLLQAINRAGAKPAFILLDLQFYFPYNFTLPDSIRATVKRDKLDKYFAEKSIDDSLQAEIKKDKYIIISVLLNNGKIDTPIYKGNYGIADYVTYGSTINKFRITYNGSKINSVPAMLNKQLDGAVYSGGPYATFCDNRLCFNYIWPGYYYDGENVKSDSTYQYYHIGSLMNFLDNTAVMGTIVKNKVIFIGNFEDDVHDTPAGKIPGTIVLADIYLSLLNGKHYVPYLWIVFLIVSFSALSYAAIYDKLPKIELKSGIMTSLIYSFFSDYFSYLGILLILSLASVILFNINVSLFLPAFIFSAIDFFSQKKYKPQVKPK